MPGGTTLSVDLHTHSEGSYDARAPVESVLGQARSVGLDAVIVTDHDRINQSLKAAALAPAYGLVGIPGVEVSTAHGYLRAIGVEECPPIRRPLAETIEAVRELGGAAVVPHPFQSSRHGVRRRRLKRCVCDAIEVYNP